MKKNTSFVDLDNAREDEQRKVMKEIIAQQHCPFCLENIDKYHTPTIKETGHWLFTKNRWPYKNAKYHFLIIYKKHAEKISDLDPSAGTELFKLLAWAEKKYQIPGGGWSMRFGSTDYSAGSVNHLHVQLIAPDIEKEDFLPVRLKIGKEKEKRQKNKKPT